MHSKYAGALVPCLALAAALLAGCSNAPQAKSLGAPPPGAAPVATQPIAAHAAAAPAGAPAVRSVTGKVLETMDASTYTYVNVDTGAERLWAASGHFDVKVGDTVVVPLETPMANFHSQSLKRDFPVIYFASAITHAGEAPKGQASMPPGHPKVGGEAGAQAPTAVTEVIPPPAGGSSLKDVWANRSALAGKSVTVRGKVVKFNGGILGRNWLHLQDGTGSAADGTNDLTVTTDADAKVGDVITVTGTLATDKDFGAGYAYKAILEKATFVK